MYAIDSVENSILMSGEGMEYRMSPDRDVFSRFLVQRLKS